MPPKAPPVKPQAPNAKYTAVDDKAMVLELLEQQKLGNQSDSGWKPAVWTAVLKRVKDEGSNEGGEKTAEKMQDQYGKVRVSLVY
jgi:hypothetical protein